MAKAMEFASFLFVPGPFDEAAAGGVGAWRIGTEAGDDILVAAVDGSPARGFTGAQFLDDVLPSGSHLPGWRPATRSAAGPQNHHLISMPIVRALEEFAGISNETAMALRNNPMLQKMSIPGGHVGWEGWHRAYDSYMVNYIQRKGPNFKFVDFVNEIDRYYATGEPARRIPGVNLANP